MSSKCHKGSWIGVDLDGTLVEYHGWVDSGHLGAPITPMVERIREWLAEGVDVRIFTARVGPNQYPDCEGCIRKSTEAINAFCLEAFGRTLPLTATKDRFMFELWDDRCVCVGRNRGDIVGRNPEPDQTQDSIK